MKKLLGILLLMLNFNHADAQDSPKENKPFIWRCKATYTEVCPLYIINNKIVPKTYFDILDSASVNSVQLLKDAAATAIYGSRGANGVVIIQTHKQMQWVPLSTLFKKYRISKAIQKLPLFFKEVEVETDSILIDPNIRLIFEVQPVQKNGVIFSTSDKYLSITEKSK